MNTVQETLSHNIRLLRLKNSYTQKYVANYLGIDRTTYTYYELCRTCPNILVLMRLSELYEVSVDEMLRETK